ncbi:MAG: penicillin acylase family protein [Wenzhouxiangella sp.]
MNRILVRSFWVSLITVVVLGMAVWFGGRAWVAGSQMSYEGQHVLPDLSAPVEILFDARGIPRIYGRTDQDVVQALGWLHAGERLFQMELLRRLARGELAELFGEAALEIDLNNRAMGFARRVEEEPPALNDPTRRLLEAYVTGINQRIDQADRLPFEFSLLRSRPAAWTVDDVLAVAYYQSFYASSLVQHFNEVYRDIVARFGPDAGQWLGQFHDWMEPTIPDYRISDASNTWVVSPARSASGAALHAADPHLDINIAPGTWYLAGLHSEQGLNVLGATAPGLPWINMGHNGEIAWAFTVAPVDVWELWEQPLDPQQPGMALGDQGPEPILTREEIFVIRGREQPLRRSFQYTPRGRVLDNDGQALLVMQWAGFELPIDELVDNALALNQAVNFSDFRQAASQMGALSVNWSYSDRHGNIGYVLSSAIPRRRHHEPFMLLDATNPDHGWDGFVAAEDRPWALNPDRGWLANANNHPVGSDWDAPIPGFFDPLRIRRITALLSEDRRFDAADMHAFQLSRLSDRALSWKDWLADLADASGRDGLARELRAWDGTMRTDSEMAGLFIRWWNFLPETMFGELEEMDWRPLRLVLDEWLHTPDIAIAFDRIDRETAGQQALERALMAGAWPLGAVQELTIQHPLAQNPLLDRWLQLSRGPIPMGGDGATLNVIFSSFNPETARLRGRAGASMRYVLDWSDPDAFTINLTLGQSGHPASPHFDDFLPDFVGGQPWVVPWNREAVEGAAAHRLQLQP